MTTETAIVTRVEEQILEQTIESDNVENNEEVIRLPRISEILYQNNPRIYGMIENISRTVESYSPSIIIVNFTYHYKFK